MNQPLAIVGASTRAAAASALRAGFQPVTADLFADADLRHIATSTRISPYPEGFLDWLRTIEPPAWMYTGALENHPELVDQMAWIAPLLGNPGEVLLRVRSPWELAHALQNAGLSFPETRASAEGLPRDGTWLAKTCRGASGSGVRVLEEKGRQGEKETRREPGAVPSTESPCLPLSVSPCLIYQQRLEGTPYAAVYVAAEGSATLLGSVRQLVGEQWLGSHGFQFAGSIGVCPVSEAVSDTLIRIGNVVAAEFELVGLFGVDFILDDQRQIWTLEVNPRYTASVEIVERATGISALAAHVVACGGTTIHRPPTPPERRSAVRNQATHGKAILYAKRDVVIGPAFADFALAEATRTPWPMLADISAAGTRIEAGRPVLTIFGDGATDADVERRLRARVVEIERILYT